MPHIHHLKQLSRNLLVATGKALIAVLATVALLTSARAQLTQTTPSTLVEVRMLNNGADGEMVFEPDLIRVALGGQVRFIPTDRTHSAASIRTIMPDGAKPFAGKIDEEITITFDTPGIHAIQCSPHYGMGMVAAVVAGAPVNLDAARAVRLSGLAGSRMRAILARL